MAEVVCDVTPGLRDSERTIAVRDVHGLRQFLRVEADFLAEDGGRRYLPIGVVGVDESKQLALIELPHEADSGNSRLWVRLSDLRGFSRAAP